MACEVIWFTSSLLVGEVCCFPIMGSFVMASKVTSRVQEKHDFVSFNSSRFTWLQFMTSKHTQPQIKTGFSQVAWNTIKQIS